MNLIIDILGWAGSGMLVLAYILISMKKVHGQTAVYQLLNLLGSIFVGVNSYYYGAFPSVAINVMWVVIGIWALLQVAKSVNTKNIAS